MNLTTNSNSNSNSNSKISVERNRTFININYHSPQSLHEKLTGLVKTERHIMHEVLRYIYLIDKTKAYIELGYGSLFDYLVEAQGYSETAARLRIDGMRILKELPEVAEKLQSAELNLSQLHKVHVAIKQDQKTTGQKVSLTKKKEIFSKIENLNLNQTESVLVQELNYQPKPKEKVLERQEGVYLTIKLTKNQFAKLKEAQSLLSHVNLENDYASLLEAMSNFVIQKKLGKKDPTTVSNKNHKAPRSLEKPEKNGFGNQNDFKKNKLTRTLSDSDPSKNSATEFFKARPSNNQPHQNGSPQKSKLKSKRAHIPVPLRKSIYQKARGCCEYVSPITGMKCGSKFQTQLDHITPLAKGGSDHATNLRLLCRNHNLSEARRWGLGIL